MLRRHKEEGDDINEDYLEQTNGRQGAPSSLSVTFRNRQSASQPSAPSPVWGYCTRGRERAPIDTVDMLPQI